MTRCPAEPLTYSVRLVKGSPWTGADAAYAVGVDAPPRSANARLKERRYPKTAVVAAISMILRNRLSLGRANRVGQSKQRCFEPHSS